LAMPVALAEVSVPGLAIGTGGHVDGACRDDLLTVDGEPVGIRITGDLDAALRRDALDVELCEDALVLGAGDHELRAAPGLATGFDLDQLLLSSGEAPDAVAPPTVEVVSEGRTSYELRVTGADEPFWLVLGQSNSKGWKA